jgi:MFS family permease
MPIRRTAYIPILFVFTAALAVGYVAWLGVGAVDIVGTAWGWGVVAAFVAAVVIAKPLSRQPVDRERPHGRQLAMDLVWEGGVYGLAEGVLLSALPPFMAWQMVHALGWTGNGVAATVARWAIPIAAAAIVVVVHHLGYWDYRNAILVPITLALTVLTVGFLVTGSWIAPALGHVFMHAEATLHGAEMPPKDRPEAPTEQGTPDRAGLRPAA